MKVKIKLDRIGQGKILLDNKDISSNVAGLSFDFRAGSSPVLSLDIFAEDLEIVSELHSRNVNIDELKLIGLNLADLG